MSIADLVERLRWPLSVLILAAGLAGGVLLLRQEPPKALVVSSPPAETSQMRVYVSGAVVRPGVYVFEGGARVEEAVRAAGGASEDADLDRINLAVRLRDEMQVQVPYKATVNAGQAQSGDDLLNLNAASATALETLPGVGPVTAQRIVEYRQQGGYFGRIEDLVEKKLVGVSTFEKIKGRITAP